MKRCIVLVSFPPHSKRKDYQRNTHTHTHTHIRGKEKFMSESFMYIYTYPYHDDIIIKHFSVDGRKHSFKVINKDFHENCAPKRPRDPPEKHTFF